MNLKITLVILSLILVPLCFAEEMPLLSFDKIAATAAALPFHEQNVRVRGFLHRSDTGKWILASLPNVKNCCVAAPQNALNHIVLEGEALEEISKRRAVTLEGVFIVTPPLAGGDPPTHIYHLNQAKAVR